MNGELGLGFIQTYTECILCGLPAFKDHVNRTRLGQRSGQRVKGL